MQKLFLAICFAFVLTFQASARVQEVLDSRDIPAAQTNMPAEAPHSYEVTPDYFADFLEKRLQSTVIEDEGKVTSGAIFVEPSIEVRRAQEEAQKSTFQKIYENALKRISSPADDNRRDLATQTEISAAISGQQQQEWMQPDFPVIDVLLPPNGQRITVPAREHIPYLMNNIEILPDGMLKFNETIVAVADGKKLRRGLTKVLPKYIHSRQNERQKLDYALMGVTLNGKPVDYKLVEKENTVLLVPTENFELLPGVHTYNFQYVADNALWDYKDFREFYWDVSGSVWNLVIAKAGATITLPPGTEPLGQEIFTGYPQLLNRDAVNLLHDAPNIWGYAAKHPLFSGEGFYIIMSLPENAVTPPTLTKRMLRLLDKYGDTLISLLGLAAIWVSFIVSWKYVRANKGQLKFSLKKSAVMLRYLAFGKFDMTSVAAFILELYKKNLIDIQQADSTVLLIKRTDSTADLNKLEQKALYQLFGNNETIFNPCAANLLKIRRCASFLQKDLHQKLRRFILRLNSGYLFFSLGMLFLTEAFIALLKVNVTEVWSQLSIITVFIIVGVVLCNFTISYWWGKVLSRFTGSILVLLSGVAMAGIVSLPATVFLISSVIIISRYLKLYGQRNGLLKEHINDALKLKDYLLSHRAGIVLGREIVSYQSAIMALGISDKFMDCESKSEYNKLKAAATMLKELGSRSH